MSAMILYFSIVVPVYNRPEELSELLESIANQHYSHAFELVVVEDGSAVDALAVVEAYRDKIQINYLPKSNSGPGDSRNYGMKQAIGNYFILVDSDCILPPDYLNTVHAALEADYADCFGGRDAAHPSFNSLQKAISFSMTSPITTGGLRGASKPQSNFQPRSFNMGLSRSAFELSTGFGRIHPGEDPDLSLRLKALGLTIRYLPDAVVYHKRRINFKLFFRQVNKFGLTRPILNRWHPGTARLMYWFPTFFSIGLLVAAVSPLVFTGMLAWGLLLIYGAYFGILGLVSGIQYSNGLVGILTPLAALIQFLGYGLGFLKSTTLLTFSKAEPEELMPAVFFKK